ARPVGARGRRRARRGLGHPGQLRHRAGRQDPPRHPGQERARPRGCKHWVRSRARHEAPPRHGDRYRGGRGAPFHPRDLDDRRMPAHLSRPILTFGAALILGVGPIAGSTSLAEPLAPPVTSAEKSLLERRAAELTTALREYRDSLARLLVLY